MLPVPRELRGALRGVPEVAFRTKKLVKMDPKWTVGDHNLGFRVYFQLKSCTWEVKSAW